MSPTIMSGVRPSSSSASAPPSTATITGRMSRMNGRSARRSRWCPTPRTTTSVERSRKSVAKRGSSILPASSSRSSRMCSIVLCAKRSSASPISLRRASVSARTRSRPSTSPRASSSPLRSTSPTTRSAGPSATTTTGSPSESSVEQRVVGQVDEQDARFDEQLRAQVRIGARRGRAAVEHRRHARRDQLLGGDAVDVLVVDQRDVAAHEVVDQQLRPAARAHRAADRALEHPPLRRDDPSRRGRGRVVRRTGHGRARSCRGHRSESNARGRRAHPLTGLRRRVAGPVRACARPCRCASAPSIRTSSETTSRSPSCTTVVRASASEVSLTIEKWRSPSEAICGRWVMHSTCVDSPSSRSRAPTARAA